MPGPLAVRFLTNYAITQHIASPYKETLNQLILKESVWPARGSPHSEESFSLEFSARAL